MSKPPNDWKHYDKHVLHPYSDGFWQKLFALPNGDSIGVELIEYKPHPPQTTTWSYELEIQIPDQHSVIKGMTINVKVFAYQTKRLDWKAVENHAQILLLKLIN